ncbi:MAG: LLM class F420-dependent oxidoreductase [Microthrixaceae bacterium]
MKIGMLFANVLDFATPQGSIGMARAAEAAGIESLWTVEHVLYPDGYESTYPYDPSGKMMMAADTPLPDPLIWLTWVAAHTETMRLGTGILILPQRNPGVLAKELSTLDEVSAGRMELGVGVGWLREEFDALGIPFEARGRRTEEYIEVMRTYWSADHVSHSGEFVNFEGVSLNPKPVNGTVPIHIGGHTETAARRAGRIGDGFIPGEGDIDELLGVMRRSAEEVGRDPAGIEVTSTHAGLWGDDPLATVEKLAAKGVHRMGIPAFIFAFAPDPLEAIAEFGEKVAKPAAQI